MIPVRVSILLIFLLAFMGAAQGRTCTAVTNGGNWSEGTTWSCGSMPASNDTITVPAGITVNVTCNCGTYNNMVIHVYGSLYFDNGQKINMSCNGKIFIHSGGSIDGENGGSKVVICGNDVYNGNMGTISGPAMVDQTGITYTLPIELLSLTAKLNSDGQAEIRWVTATETNNDYFTIEKTKDGFNYEVVGTEDGAGTSTSAREYFMIDPAPYQGISYYRLKQTDFDGKYEFSGLSALELKSDELEMTIYPNPGNADAMVMDLVGEANTVTVTIYDMYGRKCYTHNISVKEGGAKLAVDPEHKLAAGVYTVTVAGNNTQFSQKVIVK